jgi:hypothetical protein
VVTTGFSGQDKVTPPRLLPAFRSSHLRSSMYVLFKFIAGNKQVIETIH